MFVDNQTPQKLALQKHYKKGIEKLSENIMA
jgi:hypothetical protein